MGEMAEDYLQQGLDNYALGEEEWEGCEDEGGYGPRPRTCRYCLERDLWWTQTKDGFRLIDEDGKRHVCSAKKAFSK